MAELSDLRTKLVKGAFKVMQSPQFVRLLQDKRVLHVIVDGMSLRARTRVLLREAGETIARTFGLATLTDLQALEQDLRDESLNQALWTERRHDPNDVPTPGSWHGRDDSAHAEEGAPRER